MKKTLAIILTAVMVLSMVITAIPFSASAEEAVLDPKNSEGLSIGDVAEGYTTNLEGATPIDTAEELIAALSVTSYNAYVYGNYYLTADITLPDDYWPDFGRFGGNLDGCGYTITTNEAPIFWGVYANGADIVIKNLTINAKGMVSSVSEYNCDPKDMAPANDTSTTGVNGYIGVLAQKAGQENGGSVTFDNILITGKGVAGNGTVNKTHYGWESGGFLGILESGNTAVSDVYVNLETVEGWDNLGGLIGDVKDGAYSFDNVHVNTFVNADFNGNDGTGMGGLFGRTQKAILTIKNSSVNGTVKGSNKGLATAGFIGNIQSANEGDTIKFKNCVNNADVTNMRSAADSNRKYWGAGGFIGNTANGSVRFSFDTCVNNGDIVANVNAGGFVGNGQYAIHDVINCVNNGDVTVTGSAVSAGGFVGKAYQGSFLFSEEEGDKSINNGDITADSFAGGFCGNVEHKNSQMWCINVENNGTVNAWNAGGIIGFGEADNTNIHFNNCVNNGDVYGANIGGIIGKLKKVFTLENCINNGDIIMVDTDDDNKQKGVGGIAGSIFNTAPEEMKNLTNNGNVYGKDGELYGHNVAGIVGSFGTSEWLVSADPETWGQATFINCVNEGDIIGAGDVAGIVAHGEYAFKVIDCVNNGDITGKNAAGLVIFGFVGNNLADKTVIEGNSVSSTVTGTDSAAAIVIAGEGLDIADCLDNNVIYSTCNVNAYISNGVATLTSDYDFVIEIVNPNTGDNFVMGIVLSILAITAMGITAVVVLKKRVRN